MVTKADHLHLDCYMRRDSRAAYFVEVGVGKFAWVPKRFCALKPRGGSMGQCDLLIIPIWLAEKKKLVRVQKRND